MSTNHRSAELPCSQAHQRARRSAMKPATIQAITRINAQAQMKYKPHTSPSWVHVTYGLPWVYAVSTNPKPAAATPQTRLSLRVPIDRVLKNHRVCLTRERSIVSIWHSLGGIINPLHRVRQPCTRSVALHCLAVSELPRHHQCPLLRPCYPDSHTRAGAMRADVELPASLGLPVTEARERHVYRQIGARVRRRAPHV